MNNNRSLSEDQPFGEALVADYAPVADIFDEMMDPAAGVRPHWSAFLAELGQQSAPELAHCWDTAQRLVRENGTTYNVYDDSGASVRPWRMDPIPMLVAPEEWRQIEAGLIQRAKLLNAIVTDVYNERRLLSDALLPAPLVLGNPKFLRPLQGAQPKNSVHLNFMAFDIARAADHRWWVLSDRTQAPSGAGYALENRIVLARTLPEIFRDAQVHRLAGFFQTLSDNLIAETGKDEPLIVLLTPGPHNETFFEHAYLARYLGFPLVEGADLTVRDNKVFLKTLTGLKQVDLIFRRVDGDFCDPLELRTDSLLGVPGLVAAIRAGNVIVSNSLGSGVVECEALMGFLPGLCNELLGENLLLPSLATWWCGQDAERDYVINNLDNLVLHPTFADSSILNFSEESLHIDTGNADTRASMIERLNRSGHEYYAQETLTLSTAPVWAEGRLQPRPIALRVYVCADGDSYRVMPGGLTRATSSTDSHEVSMQQGDASKDTWVLSDLPVSTFSRLTMIDQTLTLRRSGSNLPSRVADNLFWLGRYAERAENSVRLFRSMVLRLAGEAGASDDPQTLTRLTNILVDFGYLNRQSARKAVAGGIRTVEREMAHLLFERGAPNGLPELIGNLQRISSLVRERLSVDSWRVLNGLNQTVQENASVVRLDFDDVLALLNHILENLAAFSGMQMENMTRTLGWRLLDTGRRLERAAHTAKLTQELAVEGDPAAEGGLDLLLELGDSTMTYRTRYLSSVQLSAVVDLLLVDDTNPRSVAFQLAALDAHMEALPHDLEAATLPPERYLIASLRSALTLMDIPRVCSQTNARGKRHELAKLLQSVQDQTYEVAEALARKYFSHVLPTRAVSAISLVP